MTYGSIIAIVCALFVIFFIPYMEKNNKRRNNTNVWISSIQEAGTLILKTAVRYFSIRKYLTAVLYL